MTESDGLVEIERAMLVIRRRQGKRTLRDAVPVDHLDPAALTWIPSLEVIEEQTPLATVGGVATVLGMDSSRASRIVAAATAAGYVVRVASQQDGRSVHLALTERGKKFVSYAHTFRRDSIRKAMDGWSDDDRQRFVELITAFAQALDAESSTPTP